MLILELIYNLSQIYSVSQSTAFITLILRGVGYNNVRKAAENLSYKKHQE